MATTNKPEPDRRRVVLSREEVEIAKFWNIDLIDFAKAKTNAPNACDELDVWPMT